MFGLRGTELLLILIVLLLLFGSTRLPQLGSSLGSAIKNFKKGFNEESAPTADDAARKNGQSIAAASTVEGSKDQKVGATREG